VSTPLLATKFYFPPGRQNLVSRSRLIERLQQGLQCPLTLVSAPAGYGKTTLMSEWRAGVGRSIPTAWLSLDTNDDDPARFLTCLIGALETLEPGRCEAALALLQSPQPPSGQSILTVLLNELGQSDEPFVLVLDDYHFVTAQPVHEALTFILEHQPPQMHLVLLTRTDPPLPLARLRVRNQLVDIRADHLRFTPDEIAVFLNQVMGLKLSADDIAAMEARTEGWIAGLQLAALSMQGCPDIHSFVSAFTGSHYYIMDYLAEEVLKLQPESVRSFLLETSILDRLCGPLCDAVVEVDKTQPVEGQAMLEALEHMNLFLMPLDDKRRWYRYHHLFADVLNRRLEHLFPHQLPELHRRASQWYELNGFIPEATHHALMAGDQRRVAQLVEQNGCTLIMRGEVVTLLKWIEAVESYSQTHPWLAIQKAWALSLTGRLDQVEQTLQPAERLISSLEPTLEVRIMLGTIAAARAYSANMQGEARLAADFARQALEYLPDNDPFPQSLRSVATAALGDASWITGNVEEARLAYTEAVRIGQAADNIHMVIIANSNLAHILIELGRLHQAARIYSETLQMATRPDGQRSPLADGIYVGLSRVSYEWNHLEVAAQYTHRCIALCRQWENYDLLVVGYVMLARLEHVQGNPDQAQEAMRAAEQLASECRLSSRRSTWVETALARLWMAQGNLDRPSHLVRESGITIADDIPYLREPEYLILLRVLLAQGDHDAALALSERLLRPTEATHRMGQVIEILVLQALALQGKKELAQALVALERALSLAQPEGYVRTFLDEGEPMAKLLYQAKSHRMGIGYAAELLSAMDEATGITQPPAQLLIEPLSLRELEVLRLIEAGYSNQQIAAKLVISIPTVKRHISNIYAKLGVESRTQAISRGRELELFE
jgi:LuxR family transcriptional regulator, maltose regulon positive regulatory protein